MSDFCHECSVDIYLELLPISILFIGSITIFLIQYLRQNKKKRDKIENYNKKVKEAFLQTICDVDDCNNPSTHVYKGDCTVRALCNSPSCKKSAINSDQWAMAANFL